MGRRPGENSRKLVESARGKIAKGQAPTQAEQRAIERVDRDEARLRILSDIRSIPKSAYIEMSGRQSKVLNEQAERYGIPIAGETIDGAAVFRWIHDFLRDNHREIGKQKAAGDFGDPYLDGGADGDVWLSRYREQKTHIAALDRQQKERELLPREEVHRFLTMTALRLRGAGEQVQRCTDGRSAFDVLQLAIDDIEAEVSRYFDGDDRTEAA